MPHYEYRCPANGRTVEVRHGMEERLQTWGEIADRAGLELGATPAHSPVERILSVTSVGTSPDAPAPAPAGGMGCGPGCACARPA